MSISILSSTWLSRALYNSRCSGTLALVLLLAACQAETTSTIHQRPPPVVDVAPPVARQIIDYDEYTGRVQAIQDVDVRSQVTGFVKEIRFREGDLVAAGDVLLVLDSRRFEAERDRLSAQVQQNAVQRDLAKRELERGAQLARREAIAADQVDQREADLASAEAALQAASAALRGAQADLDDTQVRAPFAGRVSDQRVTIGSLVQGGSGQATVLTTIASVNPVEVLFDTSEADYLRYSRMTLSGNRRSSRVGTTQVAARLNDEKHWSHQGEIDFIDNRIDVGSGTIRIRARFDNPDELLIPGLFVEIRVPAVGPYAALLVPDEAVLADQDRRVVMIVDDENVAGARAVTLGPLVDGLRVLREGINAEDRIIVNGAFKASEGAPVSVNAVDIQQVAAVADESVATQPEADQ